MFHPLLKTLETIRTELEVEEIIIADDPIEVSPDLFKRVEESFNGLTMDNMPHFKFKEVAREARVAVRTGEFTAYATIILVSGVP